MGAGPGTLPSAFICAICGSFPAGRAGGGPGAFKVQRFKVQGSTVQAFKASLSSRLRVFPVFLYSVVCDFGPGRVQGSAVQRFNGSTVQRFKCARTMVSVRLQPAVSRCQKAALATLADFD